MRRIWIGDLFSQPFKLTCCPDPGTGDGEATGCGTSTRFYTSIISVAAFSGTRAPQLMCDNCAQNSISTGVFPSSGIQLVATDLESIKMMPGPPEIMNDQGLWVTNPNLVDNCMDLTEDLTIDFNFILDGSAGASHHVCIELDEGHRCFYLAGLGTWVDERVQT